MTEANLTTKQSNYYNNINPDLLTAIPLHASQVLELGAGAGALGAAFKRRNPKAHWIGVELMREAASLAAHRLDEVIVADAEDEQSSLHWDAWQGRMDAIVLGDVLEHLRDPWRMLARLSTCLSPQGVVIACIPNVGHWTVIQGLLQGKFTYTDQGLLDRTHLRFFTPQSMLELFNRSGLKPLTMRGREIVVNQAGFERFAESMKAWMSQSGEDPQVLRSRWLSLQYVLRAVPVQTSATPRRLVIAMLAMAPSFAEVRTRFPIAAFGSLIDVEVHYFERSAQLPDLPEDLPKVFIVQRQLPASEQAWSATVQRLEAKGWLVLAEWDDHPVLFAPRIREIFERAPWASVRAAHGVITSTVRLAQAIEKARGDDHVLIFENRLIDLPPERGVRAERVQHAAPGLQVFFGALNRTSEGIALMHALALVFAKHPQLELVVLQDKAVFEAAPLKRKRYIEALSYDKYHQLLHECDIALLPLAAHEGNACKSDLKFIECAAHEVVCIASPTVYAQSIQDGVTGLIASSDEAFAQALEALASNSTKRLAIAQAARQYVRDHRLWAQVLPDRLQALEHAWRQWRKLRL